MIINYTVQAILELCPGAQLSMVGDEYSNIEWLETERELPAEEEVVKKIIELKYQEEVNEYQRQRATEYPPYADQFDKIFHEGVDAWKADIQATKDKYPKATIDANELQSRKDGAIFDLQKKKYAEALERLSKYILSEGAPAVTEEQVTGTEEYYNEETLEKETREVKAQVVIEAAIDPIEKTIEVVEYDEETGEQTTETIDNPLVVKDKEERKKAQETIDSTPSEVIEAYNSAL